LFTTPTAQAKAFAPYRQTGASIGAPVLSHILFNTAYRGAPSAPQIFMNSELTQPVSPLRVICVQPSAVSPVNVTVSPFFNCLMMLSPVEGSLRKFTLLIMSACWVMVTDWVVCGFAVLFPIKPIMPLPKSKTTIAIAPITINFFFNELPKNQPTTLSYANAHRSADLFQAVFLSLLIQARSFGGSHGFKFKNPLYSVDSTAIDLCLKLFPWADFREGKGGVKLTVKLDHQGKIPCFAVVKLILFPFFKFLI
jgi:hypothetical protein